MTDKKRCLERIPGDWGRSHQCRRLTNPGSDFCTQHSPETKALREKKSQEKFEKSRNEFTKKYVGAFYLDSLVKQLEEGVAIFSLKKPSKVESDDWFEKSKKLIKDIQEKLTV